MYSKLSVSHIALVAFLASFAMASAQDVREPQFPLKTKRMLLTEAEISIARQNIEDYDTAGAIAKTIISRADAWLDWSDSDLRRLVPTADVPRAFNVGTAGCPVCGKEIYAKGGTYPWTIDPRNPFKVTCPVDGTTYPSNDYGAYYDAELDDASLLTGEYSDDGWGWQSPDGERYWFVAYANHWTWRNHIIPAVHYLSRAYVLTGDAAYAKKAAVLLDRIAEVYPGMDYDTQSRYGKLQQANGGRYPGKIINHIWETRVLTMLSEGYDYVWDAINDDTVSGKSGVQVRTNIEANLLEEGIDAYFSGKIRGNFGMHQKALVFAGLARQYGNQEEWFDGLLNDTGGAYSLTGLNYALYNLVYRDGAPYETSPGYNYSWVVNLTTIAEALERAGYEVYAIPKMRSLYDNVLNIVNIGAYTPSLGDSGSINGGFVGRDPYVYQSAYRAYGDPRYQIHLQSFGATGEASFSRFESLFYPPIDSTEVTSPKPASRIYDGYGMAILNNPADTISLALYYGYKGGHGHYDRLSFELFANEKVMMPDTGYPDFMNAYVPGIFSWSKNTIAHNTVAVDASRQGVNYPGTVVSFVDEGSVRALDIEASPTYSQTNEYRRRILMVDMDDAHSYFIDCFTAVGGGQHDYSLHGPPGTFTPLVGNWTAPEDGTLAGRDVPVGYLYDAPDIADEGYTGSYASYMGSGFQHLVNVQRSDEAVVAGEWVHSKDEDSKLRIHLLAPSTEKILADAQVSPIKHTELLKYLLARNEGEAITSKFVSVIEPFTSTAQIRGIQPVDLDKGDGTALRIFWEDSAQREWSDLIVINRGLGELEIASPSVRTDASFALVRFSGGELARRWFAGGTQLTVGDDSVMQREQPSGVVLAANPESGTILLQSDAVVGDLEALSGKIVHFENGLRRTAHPIKSVARADAGLQITLGDDLRVGHIRVAAVGEQNLTTSTGLALSSVYTGAYVCDAEFKTFLRVDRVAGGTVELSEPLPGEHPFAPDRDAWIVNVGPGDRFSIPMASELR